ncbi:hypothetical protein SAMN04488544_0273 [Microlunatus sagamiharensis]|uniref:Uncharacterized protein n=1 Tax=Microlunatus sagamiharensis TaxID=546874 RepID=A0A1H2LII2_9ACTN|nr:hypothetical protein [Microlunatus sagamiharensis]SDU80863.1 hypothetical protein SAMN04488544_0273 [Microlunatus sagamiharensis]
MSPQPPRRRPRSNLLVQLGQTFLAIAAAMLVLGLVLGTGDATVWLGLVLLVVGLPLLLVGLRRQRAGAVPPAEGPPRA